jgi:hypothetical protein
MSIDPENQELPYTDDGPTEDVDIEITEEDLGESLEDYEQQEEPEEEQPEAPEEVAEQEEPEEVEEAPKRRRSPEKRISELARKAAEAEQRAQALEARLQKESQLREQSEQAMMTHYRNNLSVTAMDLKQKLSEARSMMDNEKIDDLQYQFNKTMNDLEAVTNWEREQQNKASRPVEPAAPQPSQQQQVTLEPRTASWIQKNTWFQPKSEDFDPEMHEEATLYARRVERRFRAEGRDDEIGSVDYFTEIDRHLRREFPDAFAAQATPTKRAPPMSRDSNAAPVQRTAPGQPPRKSTSIRLSADERRMAHQMAQSGAYRNPNGSRMNDLEAEKYHAIYILKTKKGAN